MVCLFFWGGGGGGGGAGVEDLGRWRQAGQVAQWPYYLMLSFQSHVGLTCWELGDLDVGCYDFTGLRKFEDVLRCLGGWYTTQTRVYRIYPGLHEICGNWL